MKGTFPYCRTKEAIQRIKDGDTLQHIKSEMYFKEVDGILFTSEDNETWNTFDKPLETFPPYDEWRSATNLHYYQDLIKESQESNLRYLTFNNKIVKATHPEADKSKKRWFVGVGLI